MKIVLIILVFFLVLSAQELKLDNLLKEYEDSASLYKKTKKESAGFLLIYSREDIEKMQAFSLKDILKTVRAYTLQTHAIGVFKLQLSGQGKSALPPVKLYIDNFEVTTVAQGNALDIYGDMNIYFVDHIEIYQGASSIAFGNSPGSMVIRLYSKDPTRENSSSVELATDSKLSLNVRGVHAGIFKDYEYLFYANAKKINYDKYERNQQELSRDSKDYQAHFKISRKDDFEIVTNFISASSDIFNGLGQAPLGDESQRDYAYIDVRKHFNSDITLSASVSSERKMFINSDAIGIGPQKIKDVDVDIKSHTYKIDLRKKIVYENHDFLMGIEFQQNKLNIERYKVENIVPIIGPKKLDIYMIYFEELYNLNKDNLFALSAKFDYYKNSFSKESSEYALRASYISLFNDNWSGKFFFIRRYLYPNMLQTTFTPIVYNPNPELNAVHIDMALAELEYKKDKNRIVFGYGGKIVKDALGFDKIQRKYINLEDNQYFNRIYIRGEHHFNLDNKIVVEYFKVFKESYNSPASGMLIQSFNSIGKFSIYNEFTYRKAYDVDYGLGYVHIDNGYDYTVAVSYPVNKAMEIKVKAENIFDKASETLIDAEGLVKVPAIQRRTIMSLEYTF